MKRIAKDSRQDREAVMAAATSFFGPDGLGLEIAERSDGCVTFEGGGGFVRVSSEPRDHGSAVEVETAEWEQPATQFLADL